MAAAFLLLVVFNIFLSDVLHDKVHRTGTELAKQVYELNLDPVVSQDIIATLVKSQGFAMNASDVPQNFANFIDLEQEVFSYKTVNLRLFHWPSWLVESHLFIFLNLILLGTGYWGFRWWKKMFKQLETLEQPQIQSQEQQVVEAPPKQLTSPKPLAHQDLNILYGVPTNYNHLFALFFWKSPFPANLDIDNYFKLVIAKGFGELVHRAGLAATHQVHAPDQETDDGDLRTQQEQAFMNLPCQDLTQAGKEQ